MILRTDNICDVCNKNTHGHHAKWALYNMIICPDCSYNREKRNAWLENNRKEILDKVRKNNQEQEKIRKNWEAMRVDWREQNR